MSAFERLFEPGSSEEPRCRYRQEMKVAGIERLPEGRDAYVRVYDCEIIGQAGMGMHS